MRHDMISRALRLCAALACALPAARAGAQGPTEAGMARDARLRTPLECLHVVLLDSTERAIAHTVTDSGGRFMLQAPGPGRFRVRFEIFGWAPLVGPLDTLAA